MTTEHAVSADQAADLVRQLYRAFLGREPSEDDVSWHGENMRRNGTMAALSDIVYSQEAIAIRSTPPPAPFLEDGDSIDRTIAMMYRLALGRAPRPADLDLWREAVADTGRLSHIVFAIGDSAEANLIRAPLDVAPGTKVQLAFEIVLGRGAQAAEVDRYRTMIDGQISDVAPLVWQLFTEEAKKRLTPPLHANNPQLAYIFGSRGAVTAADWHSAGDETGLPDAQTDMFGAGSVVRLRPADACVVSIVTSLYRGGAYIRSFLENITSQTIFRTHCELIIIDANSPDDEQAVIAEFCRDFPNIVYRRMETRIGIYEAWNIGIGLARGRYITNANVDDIRRSDSLEIQAALLDTFDFVDVTYQDVLYSFEPRLRFDDVAKRGFRTDLPIISRYNLMEFNGPHNAPMWRAALHRDIGLFNPALQSAADFEFWLRCRANGKTFFKANTAHVGYFVNPQGMSTRPDTRGVAEANAVSRELYRKLVSPMLVVSDGEFLEQIDAIVEAPVRTGRRYDVVQSALLALGARRQGVVA